MPEDPRPEDARSEDLREHDREDSLEQLILGEPLEHSAADVAGAAGVTVEEATRIWRALGFPEPGQARAFTRSDVAALATMAGAVDRGVLDLDLAVNLTRGIGLSLARLADWEVGALVSRLEELREAGVVSLDPTAPVPGPVDAAPGSAADEGPLPTTLARQLVAEFAGPFEEVLVHAWRRHLAAAVARMEALRAVDADLHTTELTIGFADIVSFTALSNELPRERIGDLVELFESRCADVVSDRHGRLIKSIGDAVLFVNDDPERAFETAEGIITVVGRDPRMPDVRVGLATGSVVMRLGDVFGPPVNMASRLTQVARRNRIIVDAATADLLPDDQFESRRLPARPVRGFGLVEPVAVRRP